jgi:hypothetical protein
MRRTAATGEQLVQSRGAVVPVLNYGNIPTTSEYSNLCRLIVPPFFLDSPWFEQKFFFTVFLPPGGSVLLLERGARDRCWMLDGGLPGE